MKNQIVWVDIPVMDLDRAIAFYSAILDGVVEKEETDELFQKFSVTYEDTSDAYYYIKAKK